MVGPGHASIIEIPSSSLQSNTKSITSGSDDWRIVWHASIGENCDRYAFLNKLVFNEDGWPYVDLVA